MNVALLIASIALVAITAVYAWFTRLMVIEMRMTRALSVAPRLALDFEVVGPSYATARITNIGAGSALRVRARITAAVIADTREWTQALMKPGDHAQFLLEEKSAPKQSVLDMGRAAELGVVVRLEAEAFDVYGVRHTTDEQVDLKAWWGSVVASEQEYVDPPDKVANRELERIRKELEKVNGQLPRELAVGLARALHSAQPDTD